MMHHTAAPAIDFLRNEQIGHFLNAIIRQGIPAAMTTYHKKWSIYTVRLIADNVDFLTLKLAEPLTDFCLLQAEQPVGMRLEYEYDKYIFDSFILQPPSANQPDEMTIDRPHCIERLVRRAYERQPVPPQLTVRVLLWNRGLLDSPQLPVKEQYWQGKLINLSVSGALVSLPFDAAACFTNNQLLGMQFTPMCHQKPILLEALVRHYQAPENDPCAYLGLEFIGLEATPEGRDLMRTLAHIVEEYKQLAANTEKTLR